MKTMKANRNDLVHGPIFTSLILFMMPLLISNVFQQLYNTVDTMIVGRYLGDLSLAAIGSCNAIYNLLVGFGLGIGNGMALVTARSYGAGDEHTVRRTAAAAIVIGVICSLVLSICGLVIMRPLMSALHTPAEIYEEAYSYISVITMFIIVMFAYNLCAALMRAIGNSVMPLIFLIISSLLNIVLDILFITRFGMGVRGAAVATVIAQGFSVLLCLLYIRAKVHILIPAREHFRYDAQLYREMAGQGMSMGLMGSIVSAGSVILQSGINSLGTMYIAAHTAARKLFALMMIPFTAMAMADSTFISQNYGARQKDRIIRCLKYSYLYNIVFAAILTVFLMFGARWLVAFVSGSSQEIVIDGGARYLQFEAPFYAVLGILLDSRFALQGLGSKLIPLISSFIEFFGKILFAMIFIPMFQYNAVIACEPVIWCFMTAQLLWSLWRHPFITGRTVVE